METPMTGRPATRGPPAVRIPERVCYTERMTPNEATKIGMTDHYRVGTTVYMFREDAEAKAAESGQPITLVRLASDGAWREAVTCPAAGLDCGCYICAAEADGWNAKAPRTVLVHLNVEVPAGDTRTADEVADAILSAYTVGCDDESVADLGVVVALAEVHHA